MSKSPSLKTARIALLLLLLPFIFAADARMQINRPPVAAGAGILYRTVASAHSTVSTDEVNHPPVANSASYTLHTAALIGPFPVSDPDGGAQHLTGSIISPPSHGTLNTSAYGALYPYYTPSPGFSGFDTLTYRVCDGGGLCDSASVTIQVVNQPPVAMGSSYTLHNQAYIGPFYKFDPDYDTLTASIVSQPSHGTLNTTTYGALYPAYTPAAGYSGQDSLVYKICDPFNACATASVTINIVNQPPVARDYYYKASQAGFIGPLYKFDPDYDTLTASIVSQPSHGTLNLSYGALYPHYTPAAGYSGPDSFVYQVCDQFSACARGTVYVNDNDANAGAASCSLVVGKPVNVSNGNMYLHQTDYQLPGAGAAIDLTRTYNSNSPRVNLFGRGWSTAYDESIKTSSNTSPRLYLPDGRAIDFSGSGTLTPVQKDFHGQLVQNGNGSYTLTFKEGSVHQFNSAGKLISQTDRNNNQTLLAYDANGNLASVTDPFGRALTVVSNSAGRALSISDSTALVATYTYDSGDQLLSVTYADNSGYHFAYNASKLLTSVTDALGNVLEAHTYDSQGRALTSEKQGGVERYTLSYVSATETDVTDALGHVTKYFFDKSKGRNLVTRVEGSCACGGATTAQTWTYDSQLNVLTKTNGLNQTTTYTYDTDGNRLTETDFLGTTQYTYNSFGQVLTMTDPMQGVTTFTYDAQGNLLTAKNALNKTTTVTYDTRGQLLTTKDARNNVTTFTWDTAGRLTEVKDEANHTTAYVYDARGRVTSATNARNETTSYEYDAAGRPKKVVYPDTSYVQFTYDLAGRRTKVRDARGYETNFSYDGAYRLTSATNADNKTSSYGYDLMSRLTSRTDASNLTTNYEYDNFNRLVKTIYPTATAGAARLEERAEYDAAGNVKKRIDTALRETLYDYDGANRLVKVTDPAAQVTQYEYNARSQTTAVVDALNQRYAFGHDALGRVTQVTRGGLSMSYVYDDVGNRTSRTDYNGATTAYTYDDLNRLTNVAYPDSTGVDYVYDELSRLSSATNASGTVSFTYDNRGRLSGTTDVFNQTVDYGYDANNNRTALTLNGTASATYQYDLLNRLAQITDGAGANFGFGYDATNRLTARTLPNGVAASYQYDGLDRLTRLTDATSNATVADAQYQYDAAGRITQIAEPSLTRNFGYDSADRLTSVQNPTQTVESYTYDAVGNRTASHQSASYSYQPFNRVVTIGSTSYGYDSNGNLTSKTDTGGVWQYSWDYENRLKQVTRPNGQTVSYEYDALGRRVRRSTGGGWTKYVYDGQDVVKDINSDGSTVEYLNGPGVDNKLRQTSGAGTLYFTQDHLGSTRALTDSSGNVVESINYDSFGNGASSLTRYGYTGREWDSDAALYYYRARFYDPQAGRFISEDPIGLRGGVNPYAYVSNNPVRFNDPSGELDWDAVFNQVKSLRRPKYPDNYGWYGTFWSEFGKGVWRDCQDQLRQMKEATYDRWVAGIKEILNDGGVRFALISVGMPFGTPLGGVSVGPGAVAASETGAATKAAGAEAVETPYGPAFQSSSAEALAARGAVSEGATLYRGGVLGRSAGPEGQFWALENPLNPSYAQRYGMPQDNALFDFIEYGTVKPGAPFITRPAPGLGPNPGGGIEVVVSPNSVQLQGFHTP